LHSVKNKRDGLQKLALTAVYILGLSFIGYGFNSLIGQGSAYVVAGAAILYEVKPSGVHK